MALSESHLLLIRTPISPITSDQYNQNYSIKNKIFKSLTNLPILSTSFSSPLPLKSIIESGPRGKYSGVIITSGRSVEAWSLASNSIQKTTTNSNSSDNLLENDWNSIPFFVVGPGTRDALIRLQPPPSELIVGHNDGGSAERLANFIIKHFDELSTSTSTSFSTTIPTPLDLPLLALVGDKNRDTLPRILSAKSYKLESIRVYETNPEIDFQSRLEEILFSIEQSGDGEGRDIVWIVLFSPSGAKHCLKIMKEMGIPLEKLSCSLPTPPRSIEEGQGEGESENQVKRFRLATIGPTTKAYVQDDEGYKVDAMAESPDPEDLLKALKNCII